MNKKKAIIIGCGIAGPILALSLKQAGVDSVICEAQTDPLDHVGLVIYVGPSGGNILKTLGLYDKVQQSGSACTKVAFNNHVGKNIVSLDLNNHEQSFGANTIAIKRGEINKILRDEVDLQGIPINWNKKLKNIEITPEKTVIAFFEDGTTIQGDFLVGCDGIHSTTRKIMMPNTPHPEYTGSFVVGGTTDTPDMASPGNILSFNFGKKAFFAHYVMPSGKTVWWSDLRISEESVKEKLRIQNDEWSQILLEQHKDDAIFFKELIRSTKDKLLKLSVYDLPPFQTWSNGPVCLVGDAAHAVAPHAGQGASLSMESAMMLAKCIRDVDGIENAFSMYKKLRWDRVKKMNKMSRRNVDMFSTQNMIRRKFRNFFLSFLSAGLMKKQEMEIYGYKINWNEKIK